MATSASVPVYKLYGEREPWPTPDMVHCELIADRSKLHDWQIKLHQHHSLMQMLYLKGGDARVGLDGGYQDMQAGQLIVVPQMCVHGFRFAPNAVGHVVTLGYPLANRLARDIDDAGVVPPTPHIYTVGHHDTTGIDMAFETLQHEYLGNRPHRNAMIEAMLAILLVWVSRQGAHTAVEPAQAADRGRHHFATFSSLIEEHYAEQWTVDQYARTIGITSAHLNNLCRQIVGQSALELIHQRVVLAAKRNLVYTSMTVSTVSYTLGFSDPAYFTRFFKRHVGVSPKEFRRQAATLLE